MVDPETAQYALEITTLAEMEKLGRQLGGLFLPGDVLLLYGGLGAGKTTLTRALGRGLEVEERYYISSPSFALMHEYPGRYPLYHIDCYRLTGEEDVEAAGLVEYIDTKNGVCVVEWPERLGTLTPEHSLRLEIKIGKEEKRRLLFRAPASVWSNRLTPILDILDGNKTTSG